jgi:mono/diheme cytochrome c family protein
VVVAIALALLLAAFAIHHRRYADPYVQNVLSLSGDAARGEVIFQMNCASCHGINGDGQVGPNLHGVGDRKSRLGLIKQVISGQTPPMPQFQPNPQEMADLLEFLEAL